MPNTIDPTTKVNIGILGTLLASAIGGAAYLATLRTSVDGMNKTLQDVKLAIDRNTHQIANDGRHLAELKAQIEGLKARVESIERK